MNTNTVVEYHISEFNANIAFKCNYLEKRLYHCNARIRNYAGRYLVLESYSTLTALYDTKSGTLYDALRLVFGYTATSNQHYYKFRRWLVENGYDIHHEYRYHD